jgi:hypothetical protein
MYMLYNMIFKIINQISSEKKARNIEPAHAFFRDVFDRATIEGIAADDIKKGLNELYLAGEIEVGETFLN